ncbi:MAG: hypothetical protein ACLFR0_00870 [Alphaproteobacteria bacterium]
MTQSYGLLTSDYAGAFIAHEKRAESLCRAATLQTMDLNGNSPRPFLTLAFKNAAGLSQEISENLCFTRHDIQPSLGSFELHLEGQDSIIIGLKSLFRQTDLRGNPVISDDMQEALLDACSDFLGRADMAPENL